MGRIKGTALLGSVKFLRRHRDEALRVLPEPLHRYLENRILPSEWFPEEDLMSLLRALTQIAPDPGYDIWDWLGRQGVRDDFGGVYHAFIKHGDPRRALAQYPLIWSRYHDGGECTVELEGERRARLEIDDALTRIDEFCRLQSGHFAQLLLLSGASDSHVVCSRVGDRSLPAQWLARWTI